MTRFDDPDSFRDLGHHDYFVARFGSEPAQPIPDDINDDHYMGLGYGDAVYCHHPVELGTASSEERVAYRIGARLGFSRGGAIGHHQAQRLTKAQLQTISDGVSQARVNYQAAQIEAITTIAKSLQKPATQIALEVDTDGEGTALWAITLFDEDEGLELVLHRDEHTGAAALLFGLCEAYLADVGETENFTIHLAA